MNYEQYTSNQEQLRQLFIIEALSYQSATEAKGIYNSLSSEVQNEMVATYQEAFAGLPWNERFRCPSCGTYLPGSSCLQCSQKDLPTAYPSDQLKEIYFPHMVAEFTPGGLLLGYNQSKKLVGFSTGGFTTLEALIRGKYDNNQKVLDSITQKCHASSEVRVFYDNETCILPSQQRGGMGKKFSQKRVDLAMSLQAQYICGRTINLPWLNVKEQQLTNAGYNVVAFTPKGDSYTVEGTPRQFYWASRK